MRFKTEVSVLSFLWKGRFCLTFKIKKYFWWVHLVGILFCSYFLAQALASLLSGRLKTEQPSYTVSPRKPDLASLSNVQDFSAYQSIIDRNIFDSRKLELATTTQPESGPEEPDLPIGDQAVPTKLPVKLLATYSLGDGTIPGSTAMVQASKNEIKTYRLGDSKAFSGVRLTKILPDQIEFINAGRLEFLKIEPFAVLKPLSPKPPQTPSLGGPPEEPVAERAGETILIRESELEAALSNPLDLLQQVGFSRNVVGGKEVGVRLTRFPSGGVFGKLGLRAGDLIQKVNGQEVTFSTGEMILNGLANEDAKRVSIEIDRNGQKMLFDYEIQ